MSGTVGCISDSLSNLNIKTLWDRFYCSNYFYLSDYYDIVKPNYYCICDSDTFNDDRIYQVHELMKKGKDIKYIFNKKANIKNTAIFKQYDKTPCNCCRKTFKYNKAISLLYRDLIRHNILDEDDESYKKYVD